MKSQLFIISAILIVIFLFGIYSYFSLSDYTINLKRPIQINWEWKSSNKYRLVYNITSFSYTKFLNLSLPNETINKSTIILFDNHPIKSQLDGNSIIFYYNLKPNEEKNIFMYYSNSSGDTMKFSNIPLVDNYFIFKNYNLTISNDNIELITGDKDELNISCYNCLNASGPVFVKIYNSTKINYFFEDFAHVSTNEIELTANNYTNGSIVYTCDGIQRTVNDRYGIFEGVDYFGFVNFSAVINCSNNIWDIKLNKPVYFLIGSEIDKYGNRFFGKYIYSLNREYVTDYFNNILSHYSKISNGIFNCKKRGGLLNSFGDLNVSDNFMNNSFFFWNLSNNKLIYDNKNLGNGLIKLSGKTLSYKHIDNKIIGIANCGNITMEFFNMSPVIYFKLNSNSVCNLTLPIGIGDFYKYNSYYLIENESYIVEYVGDIMDKSKYPYFILRPNSSFYVVILLDKRDLNTPYFYERNSLCPKI